MTCKSLTFGEVPVGAYFGKGDYFHYKNSPVTAIMDISGEQNEWEQDEVVCVDDHCLEMAGVLMSTEDHLTTSQEMNTSETPWSSTLTDEEWDFLDGKTCNPNAPEDCESCQ